jgi:hypothetical protein
VGGVVEDWRRVDEDERGRDEEEEEKCRGRVSLILGAHTSI